MLLPLWVSESVCLFVAELTSFADLILKFYILFIYFIFYLLLPSWAGTSQLKGPCWAGCCHKLKSWQNVQNIYFVKKKERGCLVPSKEKTLQPQPYRTVRTRTKTALQLKVRGSTVASCSSHELSSPWYVWLCWSLTWPDDPELVSSTCS